MTNTLDRTALPELSDAVVPPSGLTASVTRPFWIDTNTGGAAHITTDAEWAAYVFRFRDVWIGTAAEIEAQLLDEARAVGNRTDSFMLYAGKGKKTLRKFLEAKS